MQKNQNKKYYFFLLLALVAAVFCSGIKQTHAQGFEKIPDSYYKKIYFKDRIYKSFVDVAKHPEFFGKFEKYYYQGCEVKLGADQTVAPDLMVRYLLVKKQVWGISRGAISAYIENELAPKLNREMEKARIYRRPDSPKIEFEGRGVDGRKINTPQLVELIIEALAKDDTTVIIPFKITPAEITVEAEDLKQQGIRELVSTGESDFHGSSWMRINNIRVGLSRLNGVLVPQGENFSIGRHLGEVSGRTGFKRELVIKGDRTVPEYGGGLCQVSTTAFRGALLGGFKIVERFPHAYAVSYYEPFGTDATIYPPGKDFKFKNDTAGAILVQTFIDEPNKKAYFMYYGTKDTREVNLVGPYLSNYRSPPATKYEINPNLKPGEKKVLGSYHNGFDAFWQREVYFPPELINPVVNLSGTGNLASNVSGTKTASGSKQKTATGTEVPLNTLPTGRQEGDTGSYSSAQPQTATGTVTFDKIFSRYKPTGWFFQVSAGGN